MKSNFFYSLLKYRYNQLTEESLNLGVFFIFPGEGAVNFVSPKSLNKEKDLEPYADDVIRNAQ